MKKVGMAIAALIVAATTLTAIPASAANHNENVLKATPNIDGQIDAAYLESFYIEHEWKSERNSENFWANGKFEFDYEKDEKGNKVEGSVDTTLLTDGTRKQHRIFFGMTTTFMWL